MMIWNRLKSINLVTLPRFFKYKTMDGFWSDMQKKLLRHVKYNGTKFESTIVIAIGSCIQFSCDSNIHMDQRHLLHYCGSFWQNVSFLTDFLNLVWCILIPARYLFRPLFNCRLAPFSSLVDYWKSLNSQ